MLITKVIGNIGTEEEIAGKQTEWIELDWEELSKRILRKETDQGTDVALSLEQQEHHEDHEHHDHDDHHHHEHQPLQYGDILFEDDSRRIAVRTKMEPVIVISPKNMTEMGKTAFELGNRHTPALIEENEVIVRADHTLNKLLDEVGVAYETTERRFKQPFKYRGHSH
ncbi:MULTISPECIES: urease accessory protein UreE [Sporosarcina]|uniref:Urease accessory protein UreE n=1 Tax=Sporosarcina psychrophila TaxID=1476 RepID=A0ABV2K939_SPOPS|nr:MULTISPECIES: urease accessory protein UreE [Sporosarcina]AMQ04572.1 urease accessory protein UreE [Sporosarcina psychrophila]QNK88287.1 urease accessory protein UreE [Sporosarcina sp. resist]